jgi:hypothetical protein
VTSGGVQTHWPLMHDRLAPQQTSPQSVLPAGQPHAPPLQVSPAAQQLSPQTVS